MSRLKLYFEKLAVISTRNSGDVDLNRKQVVNITYLLSILVGLLSAALFAFNGWFSESTLHFLGAAVSFVGYWLSRKGYARSARMLFPFACAIYVSLCSFLYYGSDSNFAWLLIILAAYSVTGFRVENGKSQFLVCFFALLDFAIIKLFANQTTPYVNQDISVLISLCTFVASSIMIVLIAGVVVTKLRKLNDHLRDLAEKDELTKVSNRRKVLSEAVNVFADAVISGQECCFAILDLDHFKQINDEYGHDAGDRVLFKCAQLMEANARRYDCLGRYGGEEFVMVMPSTRLSEAVMLMDQLRVQIADLLIQVDGQQPIQVTASIGVASLNSETERYEQILSNADDALYKAKHNGRNRVEAFELTQ